MFIVVAKGGAGGECSRLQEYQRMTTQLTDSPQPPLRPPPDAAAVVQWGDNNYIPGDKLKFLCRRLSTKSSRDDPQSRILMNVCPDRAARINSTSPPGRVTSALIYYLIIRL